MIQAQDTILDRIKLPLSFDVEKMTAEVQAMNLNSFIYYNVILLRAPAFQVDPSIPMPDMSSDYADGSWTDWLNTRDLKNSPYLTSIVEYFQQHTTVNLVRILRLAAGNVVKEHTDPTLGLQIEKSMVRLTIPIIRPEAIEFYLNGSTVNLKPGECWYMRLTDPHKIINHTAEDRINLTIDVIPNEWVKNLILSNDSK